MKAHLYHVQINVSDLDFYRELFAHLEYEIIDEGPDHLGASDGQTQLWIMKTAESYAELPYHRKACGLNHLAFMVASSEEVDRFCNEFLEPRKIATLYDTPRRFPEYHPEYYAVYFEDPDRIKLEVVYRPEDAAVS
jgi:catechol 2,3-dioxygenase-like lactoylglutathione lyase family enzyme